VKSIYFAYYDSRNFRFEAFGTTETEARTALLNGLKQHAYEYVSRIEDPHWWFDEDIVVECRKMGICYRDREELI